jgi:hypothetical protein
MSETQVLYVKLPTELKQELKIQCIYLNIDQKDFVSLAIEHYLNHVKNGELKIDGNIEI